MNVGVVVEVLRILEAEGVNPVMDLGYPLAMVIAEKPVTMVHRGEANTRWRDFADVIAISRHHIFTSGGVPAAMNAVADHRKIELSPVAATLTGMPVVAQPKCGAMARRPSQRRRSAGVLY